MKYLKYYFLMLLAPAVFSCSKSFLDRPPIDNIVNSNFYQTEEQLLQGTAALYGRVWFFYNFHGTYPIGDQRAGTFSPEGGDEYLRFNVSTTSQALVQSWSVFYNVIAQVNQTITNIETYTPSSVPEAAKKNALAEARFMRAVAYEHLTEIWGPVPIIENNRSSLTDSVKRRNTVESVWNFIISDMRYAAENLREVAPQAGRLTKYSGEAYLAKLYLTRSGVGSTNGQRRQSDLDSAILLSKNVIANSPYKLLDNYEDLFMTKNNNNTESVFAFQWIYNSADWGSQQTLQSYFAFDGSITGFADGWGAGWGAGYDILKMYESLSGDKRRKGTYMLPGDTYSYITQEVADPNDATKKIKKPLVVPVSNKNNGTSSRAWAKKYVVGRPEDNDNKVAFMRQENNTYMLRMAEVYLTLAEAILGNNASTTDADAVNAVNMIRRRAGLSNKASITWDDIYKERMLEFALEGVAYYDFARLHYYDPQKAFTLLSNMNRGNYSITPNAPTNPTDWTIEATDGELLPDMVTVDESNFYLPLPESEVSKDPALKLAPVPYP